MISKSYLRKRRLAGILAVSSLLLLAAGWAFNLIVESYADPHIAVDGRTPHVAYRVSLAGDEAQNARISTLDESLLLQEVHPIQELPDAILAGNGEIFVFQGTRYSVLQNGIPRRAAGLMQKWDVLAATTQPAQDRSWVFGWHEGRIMARSIVQGTASEEIPVADSRSVERIAAAADPAGTGLLVAWREQGSPTIKTARHDGRGFALSATFDIGAAKHWDAILDRGRTIVVFHNREDRSFSRIAFRVLCCAGCETPAPQAIEFDDDLHLIGRQVTGLSAAVAGARLILFVSRATTIQSASVPVATLLPEPGARMIPLGTEPPWQRLAAALWPILMLFFSFSLVFVGFSLMREQRRPRLVDPRRRAGPPGPRIAEIFQRAMAHVLDLLAILPLFLVTVEFLDVSPTTVEPDFSDPSFQAMMGVWLGLRFLYCFTLEWASGRTIGKRILGIRVIQPGRARLSFRAALIRNILRLLEADFHMGVFLGAILIMVTPRRQRLGDILAGTIVTQDEPAAARAADRRDTTPPA